MFDYPISQILNIDFEENLESRCLITVLYLGIDVFLDFRGIIFRFPMILYLGIDHFLDFRGMFWYGKLSYAESASGISRRHNSTYS